MKNTILDIRDLRVYFPIRQEFLRSGKRSSWVKAVDGVSFDIYTGEVMAMVGESGCGKTTIGRTILHLNEPNAGSVFYHGSDLAVQKGKNLRELRRKFQYIFQDPYESLDPRQRIMDIISEPLVIHNLVKSEQEMKRMVYDALDRVGLHPVEDIANRYPHHLSGGQRQRVAIAAAMVIGPEFVVADEPVSMLDVSIRADILKLMLDLQKEKSLTYLFITHDLSLAWVIADRIMVLYLGKVMEIGSAQEVIHSAHHPYTQALVSVIPGEPLENRIILKGETPSPVNIPPGCRFHPRCWLYQELHSPEKCIREEPMLEPVSLTHLTACHFPRTRLPVL